MFPLAKCIPELKTKHTHFILVYKSYIDGTTRFIKCFQIINIIMAPLNLFTASQTFYNFVLLK